MLGGSGLSTLIQRSSSDYKDDPFTGMQGKEHGRRIASLENIVENLPPDEWEGRIERMEARQEKLWERLADHISIGTTYMWRIEVMEKKIEKLNKH
jgi:hypothetical protein